MNALKPGTLGLLLFVVGFIIAVPLSYLVTRMSSEQIVELVRALLVLVLISLGALLGSTGLVLLIYKRR